MSPVKKPSVKEMLDIKSVAIVGASVKMGYYWAHSMLQWDHDFKVWLVSKSEGEALGHKIYPSVNAIPENIDYAIVRVPHQFVPSVIGECAAKGAKGFTVFTSGYSELGTEEGRQRERELAELVYSLPIRVLGPNCMGLTYPKLGFAFMPTVKRSIGDVGFLSQSGGIAIATYTVGAEGGIGFSKVFSFGNQIDIKPKEIVDYFIDDDETNVVGMYLEGSQEARELLYSLRELSSKKPVVALKGGRSSEGSRAASSHTGALAGSNQIWSAAFRQANIPTVGTIEELVATLAVFAQCPKPKSPRIGLVAISGGTSVIYTDLCIEAGLGVPPTSKETLEKLDPLIKDVGTGLTNPIDLAADYYQDQTMSEVVRIAGSDPRFDSLILEADVHNIHQVATIMGALDVIDGFWEAMAEAGADVMTNQKKPVLVAIPDFAYHESRTDAWEIFVKHNLPVFRSMEEAVHALSRAWHYYERRDARAQGRVGREDDR
ncbi:hypothetical protein EU538_05630 [Candidatus Thorarchaeota archaeon]|nr:MAG: hypothetical protein EU538_05630 [Candidatus Thorarchaeota archaeon]